MRIEHNIATVIYNTRFDRVKVGDLVLLPDVPELARHNNTITPFRVKKVMVRGDDITLEMESLNGQKIELTSSRSNLISVLGVRVS